jgi:hypothetical protein
MILKKLQVLRTPLPPFSITISAMKPNCLPNLQRAASKTAISRGAQFSIGIII